MESKKKGKYIGILGALLVHVAFVALLILLTIAIPTPLPESGVTVMMGNTDEAAGNADPSLVAVDVMPQEMTPATPPQEAVEQEIITQATEETVAIAPKAKPKKEQPKQVKKPEKSAAELAAQAQKLAEARAEQERKAASEAASKLVAGAFGKGTEMGSKGTASSGTGTEGSRDGNSSTGAKSGVGGYGTFNLGGRSIGTGGLPRPAYNVQEEGKVVVSITVNPAGQVISTSINRLTNTVNTTLRKAAEDAAKKARFNTVEGLNNQTGTITYFFNLR